MAWDIVIDFTRAEPTAVGNVSGLVNIYRLSILKPYIYIYIYIYIYERFFLFYTHCVSPWRLQMHCVGCALCDLHLVIQICKPFKATIERPLYKASFLFGGGGGGGSRSLNGGKKSAPLHCELLMS